MNINELPKWAIPAVTGVVSFGAGAAAGYFLTKRQYNQIEEEIAEVDKNQLKLDLGMDELKSSLQRATDAIKRSTEEMRKARAEQIGDEIHANQVDPMREARRTQHPSVWMTEEGDEELSKLLEEEQRIDEEFKSRSEEEGTVVHIFDRNDDPTWDYEEECKERGEDAPYVIHRDEYFADEMGFQEEGGGRTFTFYNADQILVDERDVPVHNYQKRCGDLKFGHGSGDQNIVYIRNEKEAEEYEIIFDEGSYEATIMGGEYEAEAEAEELKHSMRIGRFRDD